MTEAEQVALESLRDETDDAPHHDRLLGTLIATGAVVVLAIFIGLGYLAVSTHTIGGNTQTLLTNGKTSSAIAAKKTAGLAEQIKTILITDHAETIANDKHQNAVSATRTKELEDIQTLIKNEAASSAYLKAGVNGLRTILVYIGSALTAICQATPNCVLPKT